MLIKNLVLCF